jgi:uncharacterized protein YjaZ
VQSGARFRRQIIVVHGKAISSRHALIAGANLARAYGNRLVVLLTPEGNGTAEHEVPSLLRHEREHVHLRFQHLPASDALSIAHAVQSEGGGILVLAESASRNILEDLSKRLDSPILLV